MQLDDCTICGTILIMDEVKILTVSFFKSEMNHEPVREWLQSLNKENKKTIGEDILLVQFRWPLGMPLVRKMEIDLWELRSKLSSGDISRVFFTINKSEMILLHGFIKKSQKTPLKDIELARTRKNKWFREV